MPFIGIIAKMSESNFIKNEVLKNATNNKLKLTNADNENIKEVKFEIININKENIENIKNVKFETIVINEDITSFLDSSKYLETILESAKYLIINSDFINNQDTITQRVNLLKNVKIITYGLNQHAMITISSIKKENILVCIQENIEDINGNIIEQQEINIETKKNSLTRVHNSMVIFAILAIYGLFLQKI